MPDSLSAIAVTYLPILAVIALTIVIGVWSFKICWNRVMGKLFGLQKIDLMDAAAILILIAAVSVAVRIAHL